MWIMMTVLASAGVAFYFSFDAASMIVVGKTWSAYVDNIQTKLSSPSRTEPESVTFDEYRDRRSKVGALSAAIQIGSVITAIGIFGYGLYFSFNRGLKYLNVTPQAQTLSFDPGQLATNAVINSALSEYFGQSAESLRKKAEFSIMATVFNASKNRLLNAIQRQQKAVNLNLLIGASAGAVGLAFLVFVAMSSLYNFGAYADTLGYGAMQSNLTSMPDSAKTDHVAEKMQGPIKTYFQEVYPFMVVGRFVASLMFQGIAFFFLSLYRSGLHEMKYLENEISNMEMRGASLLSSILLSNKSGMSYAIKKLADTERNFVVKKGESTVHIREIEADGKLSSDLIDRLASSLWANMKKAEAS